MTPVETAWILYDGDCRICTAFARAVDAIDLRHRVAVRRLQDADELLPGLSGEEIVHAFRFIGPDGRTAEAHDAVIALAAALVDGPVLEDLLHRSRLVVRVARQTYALLVAFRGHLMCRIPPPKARLSAPSREETDELGSGSPGPRPPPSRLSPDGGQRPNCQTNPVAMKAALDAA